VSSFHSAKARRFVEALRQSQCYEVFMSERLLLASQAYITDDPFEAKAGSLLARTHPCADCRLFLFSEARIQMGN
jgi:hypothetical protein